MVNETDNSSNINYGFKRVYHLFFINCKVPFFFTHCVACVPALCLYLIRYEYFIFSPA
jgi:hypothetical protein